MVRIQVKKKNCSIFKGGFSWEDISKAFRKYSVDIFVVLNIDKEGNSLCQQRCLVYQIKQES
jgi:hypothetical protein